MEELNDKLAALKQYQDDYDAARTALHIAMAGDEKVRQFDAMAEAEASYLEVYQWFQERNVTPIWNPALRRYEV